MTTISYLQPRRDGAVLRPLHVGPSRFELRFMPSVRLMDACRLAYAYGLTPEQRWDRTGRNCIVVGVRV